jgi:hypothetical protein
MCTLVQLVKPPCSIRGDMGLNPDGNGFFFSVYVTKLPSLILAVSIFSKTIGISYYGLSERIFKLLDYRNIEYRAGNFGKLSDYLLSDTKLKLSDYQISDLKKTINCPALVSTANTIQV